MCTITDYILLRKYHTDLRVTVEKCIYILQQTDSSLYSYPGNNILQKHPTDSGLTGMLFSVFCALD